MSAALHIDDVGFWVTNGMRDVFLDWFADYRCQKGDAIWSFCKSEGNRWPGCDINLTCLFPKEREAGLRLTSDEIRRAEQDHPWGLADVLRIVDEILVGKWTHKLSAPEAYKWRQPNNTPEGIRRPADGSPKPSV